MTWRRLRKLYTLCVSVSLTWAVRTDIGRACSAIKLTGVCGEYIDLATFTL